MPISKHLAGRTLILCGWFFWAAVLLLTVLTCLRYAGHIAIYLSFTLVANWLLYLGFRKKAIFFDAAIGVFFWLGFWLKFSVRVTFLQGVFNDSVGAFDGSGAAFDRGLLVASCGLMGFVGASLLRARFFSYPARTPDHIYQPGLLNFYRRHRRIVLTVFIVLTVGIAVSNIYLGIYQRGQIPITVLPYRLNDIYKWLLLFGLASLGALILNFEYISDRSNGFVVALFVLLESTLSNVSMLSRGMILNATAVFYGLFKSARASRVSIRPRFYLLVGAAFLIFFLGSVGLVNYLRYNGPVKEVAGLSGGSVLSSVEKVTSSGVMASQTKTLFIDRWVGVEAVLAISASKKLGWPLLSAAWAEVYKDNGTSFYDLNLINSPYLIADVETHHYISLPGIIAFGFYPGSFPLLFIAMFFVGTFCGVWEIMIYKLGGKNLILCSLMAQVIAFRLTSFGYVPAQSYLLFGSLFLNIAIIYGAEFFLASRSTESERAKA